MHGGTTHSCGLRANGAVLCWGGNEHRQAAPPPNLRLASLSTSYNHNCGLQDDGLPVCWGAAGLDSQTYTVTSPRALVTVAGTPRGDLRNANQALAFLVPGNLTGNLAFTIRVNPIYDNNALREQSFDLAVPSLDTDGTAETWTVNTGALGSHNFNVEYDADSTDGRVVRITQVTAPPPLGRLYWSFSASYPESESRTSNLTDELLSAPRAVFTDISAGFDHNCALLLDGSPECWGDNSEGQSFPPSGLMLKAVNAGFRFSCGLRTDGSPVCWGDTNRWTMPAPQDEQLVSLTTGGAHACGLREDGTPVCWGRNNYRQSTPPEGESFSMMSAGERYTCALRLDGTPMCWGNNSNGQTAAPRDEVLANIYSGVAHTCGIRPDSTPVCWGDNSHDQNWPPGSAPKPTPTPRPYELYRHTDPDCADTDGCTFSNISLDAGAWQLSVRLRENFECSSTPLAGQKCGDFTTTPADFKITIGEGSNPWVVMDYSTDNANTSPVDSLGGPADTDSNTRTIRVGPLEDGNNVERGRQTVTVHATGIWTLTFSFVRGS